MAAVLPLSAVLPSHQVCEELPAVPASEMALVSGATVLDGVQRAFVGYVREVLA